MPTSSAIANSLSARRRGCPAPMISSDSTGMTDEMLVFNERISTWFIETLITSAYGALCAANRGLVLADPVEHHDRVVQREAEDREERDHRRRA